MNAVGLSQAELGHGANPAGHVVLVAKVVHHPGRTQAADPLELEIDNPTGLSANGLGGLFRRLGGLVETDRSADRFLEPGQSVQVGSLHGLLEHEQVKLVELAEDIDVGRSVSAVAVDHEGNLAEMLSDGANKLDIATWPDLDLHPAIAFSQMALDALEQLDNRGIEPDGQSRLDPQVDLLVDRAEQAGDSRMVSLSQQVPQGVLGTATANRLPVQVAASEAISAVERWSGR